MSTRLQKLHREYADWFHLLTSPQEYGEEACVYTAMLMDSVIPKPHTVLDLGCGGANCAYHMKAHFKLTLSDISPQMLRVSRSINPECEHVRGDMRSLRLGREFDAVFAHDALAYLATINDLVKALRTAWVHCRPGGAVLLVPDCVRETFKPGTEHGGHDLGNRALRYLEWSWDPDPLDNTYCAEMVYLMRHPGGVVQIEHERHVLGLFRRAEWLEAMAWVGFEANPAIYSLGGQDEATLEAFIGIRSSS